MELTTLLRRYVPMAKLPLQALLAAAHKWKKRKVDEESG